MQQIIPKQNYSQKKTVLISKRKNNDRNSVNDQSGIHQDAIQTHHFIMEKLLLVCYLLGKSYCWERY